MSLTALSEDSSENSPGTWVGEVKLPYWYLGVRYKEIFNNGWCTIATIWDVGTPKPEGGVYYRSYKTEQACRDALRDLKRHKYCTYRKEGDKLVEDHWNWISWSGGRLIKPTIDDVPEKMRKYYQ